MKVIKPSYEILTTEPYEDMVKRVEQVARTCYKSEDKMTDVSGEKMIKALIKSGHKAMIEHASVTVKFTVDRGISHEIVRHRLASFAQESTRYCNYGKEQFEGEITVIKPVFFDEDTPAYSAWYNACKACENSYFELLDITGAPEQARDVLPTSVKTELNVTMNMREWRHFFALRALDATGKAHPQVKEVALPLLEEFKEKYPAFFADME